MSDGEERDGGRYERVSQLCKPLWNCLHCDQSPLSVLEYFIQFMATRDAIHLLQFWFSVNSFRNATSSLGDTASLTPSQNDIKTSSSSTSNSAGRDNNNEGQSIRTSSKNKRLSETVAVTETGRNVCQEAVLGNNERVPLMMNDPVQQGRGLVYTSSNGGVSDREDSWVNKRDGGPPDITRQPSLNVVSDAMGIYTTYIALNATHPTHVPDNIRQRIEVSICPEDGLIDRTCFNEAQQFVYNVMEDRYYPEFLRSPYLCKYQLELVSSGQLSLLDFLLGGDSLGYFMEFMEADGKLSLLQFWLTADSFSNNISSNASGSEANINDAISIYERYFSLQATEPLGMGDQVRVEIEVRICEEKGPRPDSFLPAQLIAYDIMKEKCFPSFLESGQYLKFLHCLLAVVKSTPCDSEREVNSYVVPSGSHSVADPSGSLSTNTDKLFPAYDVDDPESLWKRGQLLMRLGHVDSMGHYCSEIAPFPSKTGGSKDGDRQKQFRWFKNKQEEEEWEYAVKVSRNIVTKILKRTSRTPLRI